MLQDVVLTGKARRVNRACPRKTASRLVGLHRKYCVRQHVTESKD